MSDARKKFSLDLCREHFDDASFLWSQRLDAVAARDKRLMLLADLDGRLQAHIDGIRVAGTDIWCSSEEDLPIETSGDIAVALFLALGQKHIERIDGLHTLAEEVPSLRKGLVSAFGWSSRETLQGIVQRLLTGSSAFRRWVGIACCAVHRVDPNTVIDHAIRTESGAVAARSLRAAGELGRVERRAICLERLTDENADCRLWAAWSAVMLGDRNRAIDELVSTASTPDASNERARQLAFQVLEPGAADAVLQELAGDPARVRMVIRGSGIAGDPTYVPWLIGHMLNDATARLAGDAFSLITGGDLLRLALDRQQQARLDTEMPDEMDELPDVADPDDELPWPDAEKVARWWKANAGSFRAGTRYFMGAQVTRKHCIEVLRNGYQWQRILASHYLCLLEPGTSLFNTSAPAWRQLRLLGRM